MEKKKRKLAQNEEKACWEINKEKLNKKEYFQSKSEYWNSILKKCTIKLDTIKNSSVLEV